MRCVVEAAVLGIKAVGRIQGATAVVARCGGTDIAHSQAVEDCLQILGPRAEMKTCSLARVGALRIPRRTRASLLQASSSVVDFPLRAHKTVVDIR